MTSVHRAAAIAALTTAACAVGAAPALAADKPAPCTGIAATDASDDNFVGFIGLFESPQKATPNTDFTSMFFRTDRGNVTVHWRFKEWNKTVPADATNIVYRLNYATGEATNYVQAILAKDGTIAYSYGHVDGTLVKDGDTTGEVFEGADGGISIAIPDSHVGDGMGDISAFSAYVRQSVNTQTDAIPDGDETVSYTPEECPAGSAAVTGTTPETKGSSGQAQPPSGSGGSGGSGGQQQTGQPRAAAPMAARIGPRTVRRRAVRRRTLRLSLQARESLTNVVVTLRKGRRTVASGKLAKASGDTSVRLRLKGRRLAKGAYTVTLTAKRADGSTGSLTAKLRVK